MTRLLLVDELLGPERPDERPAVLPTEEKALGGDRTVKLEQFPAELEA